MQFSIYLMNFLKKTLMKIQINWTQVFSFIVNRLILELILIQSYNSFFLKKRI